MTGHELLRGVLLKAFEPNVGNELEVDDGDAVEEWQVEDLTPVSIPEGGPHQRAFSFDLVIAGGGGRFPGRYRITLRSFEPK